MESDILCLISNQNRVLKTNDGRISSQDIISGTVWITLFVAGSKVLGFVRQMLAGMLFGTSRGYDAVIVALGPTDIVAGIIAGAFASIAVPIYIEEKRHNHHIEYARSLLTFTSIFLVLFGITLAIFPSFYIHIFAPTFEGEEFRMAENYLRIYSLLPLLNGWSNLFGSFLRAERMFFQYSVAQFSANLFLIPAMLVFYPFLKEGSYALSLEFGTGAIGLTAYLYGRKIWGKIPFGFGRGEIKHTFYLAIPLLLSSSVATINSVVDRAFASGLEVGSISSLNYSFTIVGMINGIITSGILTTSLTSLSENAVNFNGKAIVSQTRTIFESMIKILAPITAFTIVCADLIVKIIYQRGAFTAESTLMTASTLVAYSPMIITVPLTGILGNIYISKKQTLRLTLISVPMIFLNAYLDWILMIPLKQEGIAASSSIVSFLLLFLMIYDLGISGMRGFFSIKTILPIMTSIIYVIIFLFMLSKLNTLSRDLIAISVFLTLFTFFGRNEIRMVVKRFIKK